MHIEMLCISPIPLQPGVGFRLGLERLAVLAVLSVYLVMCKLRMPSAASHFNSQCATNPSDDLKHDLFIHSNKDTFTLI